jgi:thiamine-monophosphate kinase
MTDDSDESHIIRTILRSAGGPVRDPRAPGHDGVVVAPARGQEVVAIDTLVEGVHFDHRLAAADVGWKCVAVNVSDIGAMGASPTWALLSLALPAPLDRTWVDGFAEGLHAALDRWRVALVGGDTVRSPGPVVVTLSVAGEALGLVPGRGGALPGDALWVTGRLGRASAGFAGIGDASWLRRPEPPVAFGAALAAAGIPHAMMDLSDGLRTDLARLCATSGVGASVDPDAIPLADELVGRADALDHGVGFGDDYELLFATDAPAERVAALAAQHGTSVARIGTISSGRDMVLTGRTWPPVRFTHFGSGA